MQDSCEKCRKRRDWKAKRDRAGRPMFRRVSRRGRPGWCQHVLPLRMNVYFPPEGVL